MCRAKLVQYELSIITAHLATPQLYPHTCYTAYHKKVLPSTMSNRTARLPLSSASASLVFITCSLGCRSLYYNVQRNNHSDHELMGLSSLHWMVCHQGWHHKNRGEVAIIPGRAMWCCCQFMHKVGWAYLLLLQTLLWMLLNTDPICWPYLWKPNWWFLEPCVGTVQLLLGMLLPQDSPR